MIPRIQTFRSKQASLRSKALPGAEGLVYDCSLAAKIREGDSAALARLLGRHQARVNRYLQHRVGAGHEPFIQDVIKATFDDALRRLRPYATGLASTPMEYWLIRLAERNLRKLTSNAGKAKLKVAPDAKADREEDDLTIARRALSAVPTQDAFVLALALFEGMSALEIALTLGVGQARAMKRLRNAMAAISKQLPSAGGAA